MTRKIWTAWEQLFAQGDLKTLSSKEIKERTGQEPRLMTKFDSKKDVPPILTRKGLNVLPVSNGQYVFVHADTFHDLETIDEVEVFESKLSYHLDTLTLGDGESRITELAHYTGLLETFLGLDNFLMTIRGRRYTPRFEFDIGNERLTVQSVQFEVDAGYEGAAEIVLIEAKVGRPENFNIRQLYYPYRAWQKWIPYKEVIPVFLVYDNETDVISLWRYSFKDPTDLQSISLVKAKKFIIVQKHDWLALIKEYVNREPRWDVIDKVPQADDFLKVAEFPFAVLKGYDNSPKLAEYFGFTRRQSSYYREAAELIGLVNRYGSMYALTEAGHEYVEMDENKRDEFLLRALLRLPIIHETWKQIIDKRQLNFYNIVEIIEQKTELQGATPIRRAKTVMSWFEWIERKFGLIHIEKDSISLMV